MFGCCFLAELGLSLRRRELTLQLCFFNFIETFDNRFNQHQTGFLFSHLVEVFLVCFGLEANLKFVRKSWNSVDDFRLQSSVTVIQTLELLLKLPLVKFLDKPAVELLFGYEPLDHHFDAVHLLQLVHIEPGFKLCLKTFNRYLQLSFLDQILVYLHVMPLNVDLHFSQNIFQLADVLRGLSDLLLVDHRLAELKLNGRHAFVFSWCHIGELHGISLCVTQLCLLHFISISKL